MSIKEYRHLRADLAELDRLIAMTPESDVIDRSSLEARRNQVAEGQAGIDRPPEMEPAGWLQWKPLRQQTP